MYANCNFKIHLLFKDAIYGTDHFQLETRMYRIVSVHKFIVRFPLKHVFFAFFLTCATAPVLARLRIRDYLRVCSRARSRAIGT